VILPPRLASVGRHVRARLATLPRLRPQAEAAPQAPLLSPQEMAELAMQASLLTQSDVCREIHDHHAGDWPSAWLGRGLDFEEARPYAPGDDIRDMDWRTTARLGHPFIKTYREERQPMLHLLVDRGPGMRFGTRRRLKVAQAARIATLLTYAAAPSTAVGATLWEPHTSRYLPPRHDRAGLLELVRATAAPCPPLTTSTVSSAEESLEDADRLARLAADLPRGTRLMLLSDFAWLDQAPDPRLAGILARLGTTLQVQAIRIQDPVEHALPDVGLARFQDLANSQPRWLDTHAAAVRKEYAQAADQRRARVGALLARADIPCLDVASDVDDLLPLLTGHA